ncbi:MAG: HEAT repeat domain-containing protein [Bryobacteraceae bacterium]|jgi:HEAT repeat protein
MIRTTILILVSAGALMAQSSSGPFSLSFQAQQGSHEDADYREGRRALDASQWDKAIASFDASASHKGATAAGALYWKAYAQNRAGRREEALATIRVLRKEYPSSRWINDAQALDVEMGAGVSPGAESDEDLKIIALNSLMQSDPKQAFPILEKVLKSNNSPKLKEKALFVLTQSPLPEARKLLSDIARGSSNPELQAQALRYMGMMGNDDSRKELVSIYESTGDKSVKHAILKGLMMSGSRAFLLTVAKGEKDPELRADAIKQLAMTGGQEELWQLYQSTSSMEDKEQILKSMFMGGNSARLVEVAQSNTDARLRIAAIKSLGLMGGNGRGDVLVAVYKSDQNREVREAVLKSLFLQQNAKALVELARAEKDPEMKRDIIRNLSLIQSKETTDYMMEILK